MNINCQADPCPVLVNASCVFYEGPNLICLGVTTNETLESALEKINSVVCQVLSQQGSSGTSGTSGSSGTHGTSGTSGIDGTSGSNGRNGSSGTSGSAGSTGSSGSAGSSGTSGQRGDIYRTVSTTCFTLGDAGTIFVEPGLAYTPAQSIVIANSALIYQVCTVVSYNNITGELVFSLPTTVVGAIDEYCTWDVNLNGASGGDGSSGTSGTNGSAGTSGSQGSAGSNGTSGISCLSAVITNTSIDTNLNVIYTECNGTYQNYDIGPSVDTGVICYQSGTLELIGDYTLTPLGICSGTSGTSGFTCTSLEVTNLADNVKTYNYTDCTDNDVSVDIPAGEFISICAISWNTDSTFNIVNNGVCTGTSGTSGTSGAGGSGTTCPDHFKLAAVSGRFASNSPNSNNIAQMFSGSENLGWSYGDYVGSVTIDGFGNLLSLKYDLSSWGIPLSVDLNVGDTIKIAGIAYISDLTSLDPQPVNPTFYITVSRFNCSQVSAKTNTTPLTTVIPVTPYPIDLNSGKVCFSESINLAEILPSNETFFVVGMGIGNEGDPPILLNIRFSYTLDVTQACIGDTGQNLLISNCCDPAYKNVIINNLVPLGESFVDNEGNCWTVESETLSPVTAVRTLVTSYVDCDECITNNPCPLNFTIQSCCGEIPQVFSAALIGVDVGDTFVDTNGYCWSAIDTTPLPITNIVEVDTVYPITNCGDAVCTDLNACPTPVRIEACCRQSLIGYTSLELLQAAVPTLGFGSVFVDTFGMCWTIKDSAYAFPDSTFIVPVTDYGPDGCVDCITANPCPKEYYYTVQNCCTEEIEVLVLGSVYPVGEVLNLLTNIGFGCYKVLSWSDTGTITGTVDSVISVSKTCDDCNRLISEDFGTPYCQGYSQCCTSYTNIDSSTTTITGYKCDGTWLYNYVMAPGETICMAILLVFNTKVIVNQGCCGFDIFNPSTTTNMRVNPYRVCPDGTNEPRITIPPLGTFSETYFAITDQQRCLTCVTTDIEFEYLPCPF